MPRDAKYFINFKNKRWGNCRVEIYPAMDGDRAEGDIEEIKLPDTIFEKVGELSAEFNDLPVGLSEIAELKISLKLNQIPDEVLAYIVEPRSLRIGLTSGPVPLPYAQETENIWVFKSDLGLGGAPATIFIGTQLVEKVKKTTVDMRRATMEITLTHALVAMGDLVSPPDLGWHLYSAVTVSAVPKFDMRDVIKGTDYQREGATKHRKYFFTNNNGFNDNEDISTFPAIYYKNKATFNFGVAKFFRKSDIFVAFSDLCEQHFTLRSTGLVYDFKVENPYKIITFFKQNFSSSSVASEAIGSSLGESSSWILGFYAPDFGRGNTRDELSLGLFFRPQMADTSQGGYKNFWEVFKDMTKSCMAKGIISETMAEIFPVFASGRLGTITPQLEKFSSKIEFEESYQVYEKVIVEKIDGMTDDDYGNYEISTANATGEGEGWSFGRFLLTNAPSADSTILGQSQDSDNNIYNFFGPFPENRIYYFDDELTSGIGIPIRVHHHCEIKISNANGDNSSTVVEQYVADEIFGDNDWSKVHDHLLKIQINSTLPYIAAKLFIHLFANPTQGKMSTDTRDSAKTRFAFLGQHWAMSPEDFAPGQFEHISNNAFLLKSATSLTAEPGSLDKAEFFVRGV